MIHRYITTVGALIATCIIALMLAGTASANFAGDACNHIRYGGGAQANAAYFNDARWGSFTWYWAQIGGNTPVGFAVNTSQMRADGSGYCYASWYARHYATGLWNICQYYANKAANGVIYSRWDNCHG